MEGNILNKQNNFFAYRWIFISLQKVRWHKHQNDVIL